VAPDHQRQGIGSALVRAALAAADRTDGTLVTLEGSPAYYGRLGFRYAADLGIRIRLPDWAPPEAAQVFPLTRYRAEVRGQLEYPPAFDVLT
jgi:putative acetyltransferase